MTSADCAVAIQVFARAPIRGRTKTRLIPALGDEAAALLHARMIECALDAATAAAIGPVELWCDPDRRHPFFQHCRERFAVGLHDQYGGSLGERLRGACDEALRRGGRVLVIGSDCPILDVAELRAAASQLLSHDAVVTPAHDGGYVLLGLARPCPELFCEIDWGSSRVLAQSLERLQAAGVRYRVRPALWDVDRPEDLARLGECLPALLQGLPLRAAERRK